MWSPAVVVHAPCFKTFLSAELLQVFFCTILSETLETFLSCGSNNHVTVNNTEITLFIHDLMFDVNTNCH